ncbi:hypothetical protein ABRZ04_05325 [Castellaniella ginsengisoli]|uniref:DUF4376 domain-containing protein n=1 Tax=Castellaniella ginsengisoli TaxID=546114 RepID=A0AB39D2H5_9BURK
MDKHTFTPGPWRAQGLCVRAIENGVVVAEVDGPNKFFRGSERREEMEYCRGNARLIAAAPDLLEALIVAEAALNRIRCTSHTVPWEDTGPAVEQARVAIAKATEEATC